MKEQEIIMNKEHGANRISGTVESPLGRRSSLKSAVGRTACPVIID